MRAVPLERLRADVPVVVVHLGEPVFRAVQVLLDERPVDLLGLGELRLVRLDLLALLFLLLLIVGAAFGLAAIGAEGGLRRLAEVPDALLQEGDGLVHMLAGRVDDGDRAPDGHAGRAVGGHGEYHVIAVGEGAAVHAAELIGIQQRVVVIGGLVCAVFVAEVGCGQRRDLLKVEPVERLEGGAQLGGVVVLINSGLNGQLVGLQDALAQIGVRFLAGLPHAQRHRAVVGREGAQEVQHLRPAGRHIVDGQVQRLKRRRADRLADDLGRQRHHEHAVRAGAGLRKSRVHVRDEGLDDLAFDRRAPLPVHDRLNRRGVAVAQGQNVDVHVVGARHQLLEHVIVRALRPAHGDFRVIVREGDQRLIQRVREIARVADDQLNLGLHAVHRLNQRHALEIARDVHARVSHKALRLMDAHRQRGDFLRLAAGRIPGDHLAVVHVSQQHARAVLFLRGAVKAPGVQAPQLAVGQALRVEQVEIGSPVVVVEHHGQQTSVIEAQSPAFAGAHLEDGCSRAVQRHRRQREIARGVIIVLRKERVADGEGAVDLDVVLLTERLPVHRPDRFQIRLAVRDRHAPQRQPLVDGFVPARAERFAQRVHLAPPGKPGLDAAIVPHAVLKLAAVHAGDLVAPGIARRLAGLHVVDLHVPDRAHPDPVPDHAHLVGGGIAGKSLGADDLIARRPRPGAQEKQAHHQAQQRTQSSRSLLHGSTSFSIGLCPLDAGDRGEVLHHIKNIRGFFTNRARCATKSPSSATRERFPGPEKRRRIPERRSGA